MKELCTGWWRLLMPLIPVLGIKYQTHWETLTYSHPQTQGPGLKKRSSSSWAWMEKFIIQEGLYWISPRAWRRSYQMHSLLSHLYLSPNFSFKFLYPKHKKSFDLHSVESAFICAILAFILNSTRINPHERNKTPFFFLFFLSCAHKPGLVLRLPIDIEIAKSRF